MVTKRPLRATVAQLDCKDWAVDQYQTSGSVILKSDCIRPVSEHTLEAQLPVYWVPVLKSLYTFILSIT